MIMPTYESVTLIAKSDETGRIRMIGKIYLTNDRCVRNIIVGLQCRYDDATITCIHGEIVVSSSQQTTGISRSDYRP